MKKLGDEVYIQRGEVWSLDFAVRTTKNHPFVVLKNWLNPYLAITVAAALYEQRGDYRETYWLDLQRKYVEQQDGNWQLEYLKRFISAEPLFLPDGFEVEDIATYYNDKIVFDKDSDFDVTNFLFFTDPYSDGNNIYKYIVSYELDGGGQVDEKSVVWAEYDFRIIKQFVTKNWMEQAYWYDIKVLAGESVQEHLAGILEGQGITYKSLPTWTNEDWEDYLNLIEDIVVREEMWRLYDEGAPLMPTYDTKSLLLEPTPIYVSANIQGGVK